MINLDIQICSDVATFMTRFSIQKECFREINKFKQLVHAVPTAGFSDFEWKQILIQIEYFGKKWNSLN